MKIHAILHQLSHQFTRWLAITRETLQEIFEESAYARFLVRQGVASSREAYSAFLRESESSRVRRPRCC